MGTENRGIGLFGAVSATVGLFIKSAIFLLTLGSLIYWAARSAWLKSKGQNLDDMVRQGNSRLILEQLGIDPANGGKV